MHYNGTAYSLLNCKAIDENRRTVTGVATTPTVDRVGDSVNPLGAKFKTPMPLLLYHNHVMPVGTVDFARPTKVGIPFEASLPLVSESGVVQDRVNEALHSLKYKLLGFVSIGFRAFKEKVKLLESGGLLFDEWEWLELTLCSIPANPEAVVHGMKSHDMAAVHRLTGTSANDDRCQRSNFIDSIKSADPAIMRAASSAGRIVRLDPKLVKASAVPGDTGHEKTRRPGVVYLK